MNTASIPPAPLALGLAGLLPFLWGAGTHLVPALAALSVGLMGPGFTGVALLQVYGLSILSFMAGVIWGFSTRSGGRGAAVGYALSVLPALWAVLVFPARPGLTCAALAAGFVGLLALDLRARAREEAPGWWLSLRYILTAGAALCLLAGALG